MQIKIGDLAKSISIYRLKSWLYSKDNGLRLIKMLKSAFTDYSQTRIFNGCNQDVNHSMYLLQFDARPKEVIHLMIEFYNITYKIRYRNNL